ncbi:MAG: serine/threonine-protein kinase, partial [Desulfobacterales bacterium]
LMNSIQNLDTNHLVGRTIGTSTILKELARGGMAIVFIAFQRTLKRQIAVKLLPKDDLTPENVELFQSEAEAAAILSHPSIIQIYDVGETEDFLYFTMQLVRGNTLGELLKRSKKQILPSKRLFSLKKTIQLTNQILDALDHAHNYDIIHLDIKPDNILIENHTKRPLISDFGIAKVLRGEDHWGQFVRGSPLYMAPEQILGPTIDGRTDVYAVGTMLFQMLVPDLPIKKYNSHESLLEHKLLDRNGIFLKNPSELNSLLHPEMDRIVYKALAYDPDQRYPTCRDFMKELQWYERKLL